MNRSFNGRGNRARFGGAGGGRRGAGGGRARVSLVIVALGVLAGVVIGVVALSNRGGKLIKPNVTSPAEAAAIRELLDSTTFYDGVYVDEIPLGGLTMDQAREQVEEGQRAYAAAVGVTVTHQGQSWKLNLADAAHTFDTQEILNRAYEQGRTGTDEERLAFIRQLPESPVKLATTETADPAALQPRLEALAEPFAVAPVNAAYQSYDLSKPDGERLAFSPDTPGSRVDTDALWAAVKKAFDERTYGTVAMATVPVEADLTLSELQAGMQLVARFDSTMKDHTTPRLTNITISSAAVSGRMLMPGEVFSYNDATGERTAEKGYMVAHVINGGVTDNGLAGGTCQVSGTLWNVVVRADLEIVERNPHSLRSSYLPMGQDATVDWGHYDLKFKNNKDKPVLIIMYIGTGKNKYKLFGEVYGTPLPDGVTIELLTKKTATVPAPNTVSYAPSDAVKPGTTETNAPRDGVKATTYKVYKKDGKEIDRVVLHKDYYREAGTVIVYNPIDGKPTPTPPPSPTPADPFATATPPAAPTPAAEPDAA